MEVPFDEYAGRKKDGSLNRQWSAKPATMIRKVALVQALREAFPQTFGGMYDADEVGMDSEVLDAAPIAAAGAGHRRGRSYHRRGGAASAPYE